MRGAISVITIMILNSICWRKKSSYGFIDKGFGYFKQWCFEIGLVISSQSHFLWGIPVFSPSLNVTFFSVPITPGEAVLPLSLSSTWYDFSPLPPISLFTPVLTDVLGGGALDSQYHCVNGMSPSSSNVLQWNKWVSSWNSEFSLPRPGSESDLMWSFLVLAQANKQEGRWPRMKPFE